MKKKFVNRRSFVLAGAATGLAAAWSPLPAWASAEGAAQYPSKLIRIVVPYPAGGATDNLARLIAMRLQERWGQTVIVDNKPGASGTIGNAFVAQAPADGYTALLAITAIVQLPPMMKGLTYDYAKDLKPLTLVADSSSILTVPKESPVNSLDELVALVKANPGKYNFGSYGVGTSSHIQGALLNQQAGLDMVHVPYRGAAPLIQDLRGNQVFAAFVDIGTLLPHADAVKMLAISGRERRAQAKEVPTFRELGYQSFEPVGWFGLFMPSGVPEPIAEKFALETQSILQDPEVLKAIAAQGMGPGTLSTQEFAKMVKDDAAIYERIITEADIRLE